MTCITFLKIAKRLLITYYKEMTLAYYNENDPKSAAWLNELIRAGHIAPGIVDTRSIEDIAPHDIEDFDQHHFFAGIGGWSLALRIAGWPDDKPIWTGSCPCQPFSTAGKSVGVADDRHLWPAWHWLIQQRRPPVVFGEQVTNAIKHGWLDTVQSDLAGIDYSVRATVMVAASQGAPHIRSRLYFVAHTNGARLDKRVGNGQIQRETVGFESRKTVSRYSAVDGPEWKNAQWISGIDGKKRAVEPGILPLANGVSARMGLIRGYGNAIVPQVAATFIESYLRNIESD